MANIVDYLKWRGDLTLSERPFNDVDNLILATLSYMDFSGIVPGPGQGSVNLADACNALMQETDGNVEERVRSLAKLDPKLITRLSHSKRFGTMQLHDCVDVLDQERSLQFAALQIDLTPTETYVSFRGTDSTLVGWREDFMLSFTVTEAQREAARYLERALNDANESGRSLYVGGHSKGGNLAVYAALSCPIELLPQIACVWSNDGPGIAPELLPVSPATLLGERYVRIVPAYDMVGILFEREDDPRIVVSSDVSGARQHDPFTWQVTPYGMDEAELAPESALIQEAINEWLLEVPLEQRAVLVDQLFNALESGGAHTLDEVIESMRGLRDVLAAMGEMDESTKELIRKLAGNVVSKTVEAAASAWQAAWEAVSSRMPSVGAPSTSS
jgi:hypothetical protein